MYAHADEPEYGHCLKKKKKKQDKRVTGKGLGQLHMWTLQSIILNDFMQPTDKSRPVSHLFLWCVLACFCCPLCTYKPCILYFKTVSISNIPSCWLPSTNCPYRKPSRTVLTVLIQWVLQTISYWNVKKENRRQTVSSTVITPTT